MRKTKFKPTPEFERLEAQVAEMRAREKEKGEQPKHDPTGPTPAHIGAALEKSITLFKGVPAVGAEERQRLDREAAELDAAEREALRKERLMGRWRGMCPPKFRQTFDIDLVDPSVDRERVRAVLDWEYGPTGLFIVGLTGRSKTWAMHELVYRVAVTEARSCVVMDNARFANECVTAYREANEGRWLDGMLKPDVLALDDIAKRFTATVQQGLFDVLDRRTSHDKATLMTSNKTGDEMKALIADPDLGDPLIRRIKQHCKVVVF